MTNPVRTAAAFILDDARHVLLIHENYGHRRWGPPGGLVEPGESPLEAVIREVREETTLSIEAQHLIGAYFFPNVPVPFLAFAFCCEIINGQLVVPSTGEISTVDWFNPSEMPRPITYLAPHALPDLLAGRRNVSKIIHECHECDQPVR